MSSTIIYMTVLLYSVIEQERLKILAERKEESTTETYSCQTTTDSNVDEHNNGSGRTTVNKNDNVLEEITEVPVKKCVPYGYALLSDKKTYVKVNTERKSWHEAKKACESDGTHLLILDSIEEARSVYHWVQLTGDKNQHFWIGFHDLYEEGKHVTLFNQSVTALYNKWWPGYQKGRADYDCGSIYFAPNDLHGLIEWHCPSEYPYICEIEF